MSEQDRIKLQAELTELIDKWLDEQIEGLSCKIETLARRDAGCERLMSVPGIGRSSPAREWQRSALEMRPQMPRLRRFAGARSEADLDRGPHDPRRDIEAR